MECTFSPAVQAPTQSYDGAINTVGLDLGVSAGSVLGWAVFAPTTGVPPGALAGEMSASRATSGWASAPARDSTRRLRPHLCAAAAIATRFACRKRRVGPVVIEVAPALRGSATSRPMSDLSPLQRRLEDIHAA